MKVRITSRSGENTQDSLEVPDDVEGFLRWFSTLGSTTVTPPGETVQDASWGTRGPVPDKWTVHLIDEYD